MPESEIRNVRITRRSSGTPVTMCREKYHQCGRRSRLPVSPSWTSRLGNGMPRRLCGSEHPIEVRVREATLGVELATHGLEAIPFGIPRRERRRGLVVHLSPVRTAVEVVHEPFDTTEVRLEVDTARDVHRDVAAVATVGGGERDVVGRGEPHLDGEADPKIVAFDDVLDSPDRVA